MLSWLGVGADFKTFREGPKVDLRKDLKITKRVNLVAKNSHGRIETYIGKGTIIRDPAQATFACGEGDMRRVV